MSKHTPGPWLLQGRTVYALNEERIPVNRFTAHVDSGWLHDKARISLEEAEANASLISAAPELLEALEAFIDLWIMENDNWPELVSALTGARAAIAKARGN